MSKGNSGGKEGLSIKEGGSAGREPGEGLGGTDESIHEGLKDTSGVRDKTAVEVHEYKEALEILD